MENNPKIIKRAMTNSEHLHVESQVSFQGGGAGAGRNPSLVPLPIVQNAKRENRAMPAAENEELVISAVLANNLCVAGLVVQALIDFKFITQQEC